MRGYHVLLHQEGLAMSSPNSADTTPTVTSSAFQLNAVKNNPRRVKDGNGGFDDMTTSTIVDDKVVKKTVYNDKSVVIRLQGHLDSDTLSATSLFQKGFITGKGLLALQSKLEASNADYKGKLQTIADGQYFIVEEKSKGSTRKMPFRHITFKGDVHLTSIRVDMPYESTVSTHPDVDGLI